MGIIGNLMMMMDALGCCNQFQAGVRGSPTSVALVGFEALAGVVDERRRPVERHILWNARNGSYCDCSF